MDLGKKKDTVIRNVYDSLDDIKFLINIALDKQDSLVKESLAKELAIKKLDLQLKEKQHKLELTSNDLNNAVYAKRWSIGIIIALIALAFAINWIQTKKNNEKLKNTKAELNTLAKGKLHNLKTDYADILDLLDNNEISNAKEYADKSAEYLTIALNDVNWESTRWTLGEELTLLNYFYEAQKVILPNLSIVTRDIQKDLDNSILVTEVFTTLLHNSILYGFIGKDSSGQCIFNIKIEKRGSWLFFEISDNGLVQNEEVVFLNPEKPNKGLALLKRRIETEIKLKRKMKRGLDFFSAKSNKSEGITINFMFPYAVAAT